MLLAIDLECQDIKIYSNIYTFFPINTSLQSIYSFVFVKLVFIFVHIFMIVLFMFMFSFIIYDWYDTLITVSIDGAGARAGV